MRKHERQSNYQIDVILEDVFREIFKLTESVVSVSQSLQQVNNKLDLLIQSNEKDPIKNKVQTWLNQTKQ